MDQRATIGALPVAVAQAADAIEIACLPGLTMRRMADLHAGSAKTDARDAFIIAETARTKPAVLRSIAVSGEQVADLSVLAGFDDDVLGQVTAARNRLYGLPTQRHPALDAESVVVTGTGAAATIVPILASQLQDLARQRAGAWTRSKLLLWPTLFTGS